MDRWPAYKPEPINPLKKIMDQWPGDEPIDEILDTLNGKTNAYANCGWHQEVSETSKLFKYSDNGHWCKRGFCGMLPKAGEKCVYYEEGNIDDDIPF